MTQAGNGKERFSFLGSVLRYRCVAFFYLLLITIGRERQTALAVSLIAHGGLMLFSPGKAITVWWTRAQFHCPMFAGNGTTPFSVFFFFCIPFGRIFTHDQTS